MTMRRKRRRLSTLCMLIVGLGVAFLSQAAPVQGPRGKPNIILVLTDDLDRNLGTLEQLPKLKEMLAGQGVTFPNSFVSESLCCPSRASIQRGQYVHNHQVLGNRAPNGGFEKFHALHEE